MLTTAVLLSALFVTTASAQTGQRSGDQGDTEREQGMERAADSSPQSSGTADQLRDQDRMMSDDPDQDRTRTQDQDQLQDGTGDGEPDQDRDQDRDRLRDQVQTPDQLQQFIQERTRERDQSPEGTGPSVRSRTEAQVAAEAMIASERMLGQNGPRMSEMAEEMNRAMVGLETREEALHNRSRLQLFLFGQDETIVGEMQQTMEQNQERIQEMKQYMLDCTDCDQQATETLVNEIQKMEREHERMQAVVGDATDRQGLFGFLFGWLQ